LHVVGSIVGGRIGTVNITGKVTDICAKVIKSANIKSD
jgi:hypothetical protein